MEIVAGTRKQMTADAEVLARLEGAWHLVTIEQPDANGAMRSASVEGLLVFTGDGQMAVQVRNLEPDHVDSAYSSAGYEASYGSIALDALNGVFVYRVEGALVRGLVGQDFRRAYSFVDDQLILTSTRDDEKWRVVWRRG
ncbi:lipocalin-like domain-containing protein [Agrobacterium rhizogenes]|jgi:predicted house-cleaning NTP pyrophosphatase (Maf/HAM1 superfamily)|uniref:Lipocalin-like domain-containing protein n=2 Tax=unclassified Rhizobium TaxID=2613769 RepID=A0AAU7SHX2_9HYPH|nr:lipocalin-like domain-containing protein [Rhizobium rhizogenes]NTJ80964.1 lipocalin-like domain-containing protein [Rhizobium rhizogenes]